MIPLPPFDFLNTNFTDRVIITNRAWADKAKAKYFEKLKAFLFTPFQELPYFTDHFDSWWVKLISSIKALPLN